ncbi:hypothetical protein RvY_02509 [Ramazzottius varieornatus]|uniref:Acyl carrier protein n=1 Tax=Ramazzottius varieornatus TaxID=947166 RepID=A0A1D1UNC2_RAMVA|nr:hypothetical protein RvY_02509 [Ramazzottius varieornatus]
MSSTRFALSACRRLIPLGLHLQPASRILLSSVPQSARAHSTVRWSIPTTQLLSFNAPSVVVVSKRDMSAIPPLTKKHIRERITLVLQLFDKVDPNKLTMESHFHNDLGLDSLDHVEIIMAIEDEFSFEIPDSDAQRLLRPIDIAQYVCDKWDIFEEDEHHGDHHGHHGAHDTHPEETEDPWAKHPAKPAPVGHH